MGGGGGNIAGREAAMGAGEGMYHPPAPPPLPCPTQVRTMSETNKALLVHQYGPGGAASSAALAATAAAAGGAGSPPSPPEPLSAPQLVRQLCAAAGVMSCKALLATLLKQHETRTNMLGGF